VSDEPQLLADWLGQGIASQFDVQDTSMTGPYTLDVAGPIDLEELAVFLAQKQALRQIKWPPAKISGSL
jgi:hypothetical protein